jgi:uncharacterized repeat protein (TIGR01451 family)
MAGGLAPLTLEYLLQGASPLSETRVMAKTTVQVSKTAVPTTTVGHGESIIYTLHFTNNTGADLTYVVVTDTVPANTTCIAYTQPDDWLGNPDSCLVNAQPRWTYFNTGQPLLNGHTQAFSYVVQVDAPLPNGLQIENLAGSYGARVYLPSAEADSQVGLNDVILTVQAPEWAISKRATPSQTVEAGDTVQYTLSITNVGDWPTSGSYVITDVIPTNTTFESSPYPATDDGSVLTLTVNNVLNADQSLNVNWTARVDAPLPPGTIITNTAYGITGGNVATPVFSSVPITVAVTSGPALQVTKTANPETANPGDFITYTITYENVGSNDLNNTVFITDTLPDNVSFSSATAGYTLNGNEYGWFTPSLAIDSPQVITLVVEVDNPLPNGTLLTNTVSITNADGDAPTVDGGQAQAIVTIESLPVFSITKVVSPDPVSIGGTVLYTITVENTGTATGTNVILTDNLDSNTQYITSTVPVSNTAALEYSFPLGTLTPGQVEVVNLTATVNLTAPNGTVLSNQATLSSNEGVGGSAIATNTVSAPALAISKHVTPAVAVAGGLVTYTIRYTSDGSSDVTGLRLTDTLPLSITSVTSDTGSASVVSDTLPLLVFERPAGFIGTGSITIVGQLSDSPWPSQLLPLTNTLTATVDVPPGPLTAEAYSLAGPDVPADITLEIEPTITPIRTTAHLTANIADQYGNPVLDGSVVTFSTALTDSSFGVGLSGVTSNGLITNSLTSTTPGTTTVEVWAGNAFATQVVTFTAASLTLDKVVNKTQVSLNDTLIYTITVENTGNTAADTLLITDVLPADTSFVAAHLIATSTNPITPTEPSPGTYQFELGLLPTTQTAQLVITATVDPTANNNQTLSNLAIAMSPQTPQFVTASVTTTVQAQDLGLVKQATPAYAFAGQTVTYTISYSNAGAVDVTGLRLTDTLPLSLATWTVNPGNATVVQNISHTLVLTHETLTQGQENTVTITGTLAQTPWPAFILPLVNHVTATLDVVANPVTDSVTTQASSGPVYTITFVTQPAPPEILAGAGDIVITATVQDVYGNPITNGQVISFSSSLVGSDINPISAVVNEGQAVARVSSVEGGTSNVVAQVGNVESTIQVFFGAPDLIVTKTANREVVLPGDEIGYTIQVVNNGNNTINNIELRDIFDAAQQTYVASTPAPDTGTTSPLIYTISSLDPGMTATVHLTLTALSEAVGASIQNTVLASSPEISSTRQDQVEVLVSGASLSFNNNVQQSTVIIGNRITYTLFYENQDTNAALEQIEITTTLPISLTNLVIQEGAATVVDSLAPTFSFNQASLGPETSNTIVIGGQVMTTGWDSTQISTGINQTQVATATASTSASPDVIETTVQVRPALPATLNLNANPLNTSTNNTVQASVTVQDRYSYPVFDGTLINFNTSLLGTSIQSPRSTFSGVAEANLTSSVSGTTTISATVNGLSSNLVNVTFFEIVGPPQAVYLPLIVKNYPTTPIPPDLYVELLTVSPPNPSTDDPVTIQVTVGNSGTVAASSFWVDLYLTDQSVSPNVNQPWNDSAFTIDGVGVLGAAWIVPELGPGETITLSNLDPNNFTNPADCRNYSYFTPEVVGSCVFTNNTNIFPISGTIYATAQVDSLADQNDVSPENGNIIETNESNNLYPTPVEISIIAGSQTPALLQNLPQSRLATPFIPGAARPAVSARP